MTVNPTTGAPTTPTIAPMEALAAAPSEADLAAAPSKANRDTLALGGAASSVKATIAPLSGRVTPGFLKKAFSSPQAWSLRLLAWMRPAPTPVPAPPAPAPSAPAGSLTEALAKAPSGKVLSLGAGTYSLRDFGKNLLGADVPKGIKGMAGQGRDRTVIQMTPHTSTKASQVPTEKWTTNQLSLLRFDGGSPQVRDLTLRATEQGHLYNGLRVSHTTNAQVSNLKVEGVPGNSDIPPGETFGINDFRTDGSVYRNVEVDGKAVGASGFATNSSQNVTVDHGRFYGSGYAHGATFWQTKNVTITDTTSTDNKDCGFNFERVSGTVNIVRPVVKNNRYGDFRFVSDQASAKVTIVDPVFTGPKLRIRVSHTYMGKPSQQRLSDIRVIIGGVDRTKDVVEWVYSN